MKLREQNLLKRQIANKERAEEIKKAKIIQEYIDLLTPERVQFYQNMIENVKKFAKQNPDQPVFMAEISEVDDLQRFLFEEKADQITLAKVLHGRGEVCFVDQNCIPIDGRNAKTIEITKTVEVPVEKIIEIQKIVEIPVKKADAEISQNKLDKIIKKTLYEFKGKNPMIADGANQFCETFLKELSKI